MQALKSSEGLSIIFTVLVLLLLQDIFHCLLLQSEL
jgi:hypothetical protein